MKTKTSRNKCQKGGKIYEDSRNHGRQKQEIRINGENRRERKGVSEAGEGEKERRRERWRSPRLQCLPSFFSPKAKEWSENEESFRWILKVTEGTGGHICVGYFIWRDSHLHPHLGSNFHLTRIDSGCISLLNPSGIKCICKCTGRFRGKREEGRYIFLSVFQVLRRPSCCYSWCFKSKIRLCKLLWQLLPNQCINTLTTCLPSQKCSLARKSIHILRLLLSF